MSKIGDTAKTRLRDLLMGYPTGEGLIYKDPDQMSPQTPKQPTVKMGGKGPIQRIEAKPKAKPRTLTPAEKARYT